MNTDALHFAVLRSSALRGGSEFKYVWSKHASMALDIARGSFAPDVAEHAPGASNVWAAALSRIAAPGSHYEVPEPLRAVPHARVPALGREYWRAL